MIGIGVGADCALAQVGGLPDVSQAVLPSGCKPAAASSIARSSMEPVQPVQSSSVTCQDCQSSYLVRTRRQQKSLNLTAREREIEREGEMTFKFCPREATICLCKPLCAFVDFY